MAAKTTAPPSLRCRWEFGRAYRHGKKVWNFAFVVYVLPTPQDVGTGPPTWRYGVTATKKVGKAVQRNRGKRLVRESLRLSANLIRDGQDIVVVVRRPALALKCPKAQRLLLDLLARGGALKPSASSASRRASFSRECFMPSGARRKADRTPAKRPGEDGAAVADATVLGRRT